MDGRIGRNGYSVVTGGNTIKPTLPLTSIKHRQQVIQYRSRMVRYKVRIALAKNAGCLQNGSHMLLLTWTYLVSCLFCKGGKKRERVACAIHFASTQHF